MVLSQALTCVSQDRSLGSAELRVSELAKRSPDTSHPYESTGRKSRQDALRQDKGNVFKGQVHYTVEFIPALSLRFEPFEQRGVEIDRPTNTGSDSGSIADSAKNHYDDDDQPIPVGLTVHSPLTSASVDHVNDKKLPNSAGSNETDNGDSSESSLPQMSKDELLHHRMRWFFLAVVCH